ncbi:hypothetical protein H3146_10825 [Streptomyces sp. OF3]|uniref:DUF748 domain-containing protein n=1 Tax=Streptomyces alkaliterrae TaxID=2213162 RepID=A0A7W3WK92_9ACTN|nr:hypothetical protein [Streptomyces alkaliterrae]MBB1253852.1 hypothetical protein [Streptomyces alkaliterrae]
MRTGLRITAFAAALAATFGVAYGAGAGVDPLNTTPAAESPHGGEDPHAAPGTDGPPSASEPLGALSVTDGGYTLDLDTPRLAAGERGELRFTVRDGRGRPVTDYHVEHEKELHLILLSRDLATYRHLHPERAADGTWSTDVRLPRAGDHRLVADFRPKAGDAAPRTLGADLAVSGDYRPRPLAKPSATATVDEYAVSLDGALTPGRPGELRLRISRDGRPVTDLEPYLGAYGHLVAVRAGDLGYLHVHPGGEAGAGKARPGPDVTFTATAPSAGTYRLFLDFQHEGEVRTASLTLDVPPAKGSATPAPAGRPDDAGHDH